MSNLHLFLLLAAALAVVIWWRLPKKRVYLDHAIGVKTLAGQFTELIPRGAELPFVFSDLFHNAIDFQDDMLIELTAKRGETLRRIDAITLEHIPSRRMGMMDVEIRLIVSKKKKLKMTVRSDDARLIESFGPYDVS